VKRIALQLSIVFLLFFIPFQHYGQKGSSSIIAYNEKNQLLAICQQSENTPGNIVLNIYRLDSNQWIQSFELKIPGNDEISKLEFSGGGELIFLKKGLNIAVFDVFNGRLINSYKNAYDLAFSNNNSFFVYSNEFGLTKCDFYTGQDVLYYSAPRTLDFDGEISITQDDKYIYTNKKQKAYLWKPNKQSLHKQFGTKEIKFTENEIVLLRSRFNFVSVDVYNKKKLYRKSSYNSKVYSKKYKKESGKKKMDLIVGDCHLSPDGDYIVYFFNKNNKYEIHFIDSRTGEKEFILEKSNFKDIQKVVSYFWSGSDNMVIRLNNAKYYYINLPEKKVKEKYNPFANETRWLKSTEYPINFSPDMKYSTIEIPLMIKLKNNFDQTNIDFEGAEYVGFTENSQFFIYQYKSQFFCYQLWGDQKNKIITLADSLMKKRAEKMVLFKEEIPEGYQYHRIINSKHISEITDSTILSISFKNINSIDSYSYVKVHLIDQFGNYYYGASDDDWKFIWCNLLLKNVGKDKISAIQDFQVTEDTVCSSKNIALALVLDHSGSMGEERAIELQKAAADFVYGMDENLSLTIIKYDNKIGIESNISNNKRDLVEALRPIGLVFYGGATSMLDAINRAINIFLDKDFDKKAIVVFTDGKENSSYYNQDDVILNAIKNQIPVYTIGYGDMINEDDLKIIAHYTNGGFYHIHQSADFDWIFKDVYSKVNNFYTVRFKTVPENLYEVFIEVCLDSIIKDTLITAFKHQRITRENIYDDQTFSYSWRDVEIDEFITDNESEHFEKKDYWQTEEKVKDKIKEKVVQDSIKIVEEFNKIRLPDVKFYFDEDRIVESSIDELNKIIQFLNKYPKAIIEIQGYTDGKGSDEYNLSLSQRRSEAVKKLLIEKGVSEKRLRVKAFGESNPLATNKNEKGRAKNRRVEFKIISLY
jgi:outer membrane protein OmpA-like peptidoglycan-associated protein